MMSEKRKKSSTRTERNLVNKTMNDVYNTSRPDDSKAEALLS
jgi:hypothetical protein